MRYFFVGLGILTLSVPLGAQPVVTSSAPAVSSATASGGGFDVAPRLVRGKLKSVDPAKKNFILIPSSGPEMEIAVPNGVPIYSATGRRIALSNITSGMTLDVRYHPLTLEAMEIHEKTLIK